jgi:myo-inositol-1(or 4)-monophosphatase
MPDALFEELVKTIQHAGRHARAYIEDANATSHLKGDGTVVTVVDTAIERELVAYIKQTFPNETIVGEEDGVHAGSSSEVWHIDPIDGTENFARKVPFFCISVARLSDDRNKCIGIIYNPVTGQTFHTRGEHLGEVYENSTPIAVTEDVIAGEYLFTMGSSRKEAWMRPAAMNLQAALGKEFGSSMAYGSTALELSYVAANRFDAYMTFGLSSYDYAAGLLLCTSAGAVVSVYKNRAWSRYEGLLKDLCAVHGAVLFVSHHPSKHDEITAFIGNPERWAK